MNSVSDIPCRVSVIIKALNEERRIATAIETALRAVAKVGGEVILADSCSTDRTIEIASTYPIKIVQLENPGERCCGVGPQLGYQFAEGEFVYILDGDMEMLDGFLEDALFFMDNHQDFAGIGGQIIEKNTHSLEYISRMERSSGHMQVGEVDRLDMGGLYRRKAVEQVGYFSNRNLHSYEEFDLAIRLRVKGWRLWRLSNPSVNHYGHDTPPYQLLVRRWKSQYICGLGELLRAAIGKPHMPLAMTGLRELRIYIAVLLWAALLVLSLALPSDLEYKLALFIPLFIAPFVLMYIRKRSIEKSIYSVISWIFNAAGLVRGFIRRQRSPQTLIESIHVQTSNAHVE
ncbi:MAG TPA: glycosyltransferase [Rhodocyclaceae bacterium]|nr:glycosyltransferase [Rhodocyclaceae bacterium]